MHFLGNLREPMPKGPPFRLVDWTGRAIREDKRGAFPEHTSPILERLQIDPRYWLYMTTHLKSRFKGLLGTVYNFKAVCANLDSKHISNLTVCSELLFFPFIVVTLCNWVAGHICAYFSNGSSKLLMRLIKWHCYCPPQFLQFEMYWISHNGMHSKNSNLWYGKSR